MTFFLDVDRVLFDVAAVYEMSQRTGAIPAALVLSHASEFLYPDVIPFLAEYEERELVLVTFGDPEFQQEKVERSGLAAHVPDVFYTGNEMKGPVLARALASGKYSPPYIFLDDDPAQLFSVEEHVSDVRIVRMNRTGERDGIWEGEEVPDLEKFAMLCATYERTGQHIQGE